MTATPPRDPIAVQAIAAALHSGLLRLCTQCDGHYTDTPDDRLRHRVVYGHAVSRDGGEVR